MSYDDNEPVNEYGFEERVAAHQRAHLPWQGKLALAALPLAYMGHGHVQVG